MHAWRAWMYDFEHPTLLCLGTYTRAHKCNSTYFYLRLPIYLSTYLPTYLPIYLSTYLPIYLSTYLYLPIYTITAFPRKRDDALDESNNLQSA